VDEPLKEKTNIQSSKKKIIIISPKGSQSTVNEIVKRERKSQPPEEHPKEEPQNKQNSIASKLAKFQNLNKNSQQVSNAENSLSGRDYHLIKELVPGSEFIIKARVTDKSQLLPVREGEGVMFTADLIDREGDEIVCTFFGDAAVEFYEKIIVNKVYKFSKGDVRENKLKILDCHYQLVFTRKDSHIELVEDDKEIKRGHFKFLKLEQIKNLDEGQYVDVIAFVGEVFELQEVVIKSGEKRAKRIVFLYDDSHAGMELVIHYFVSIMLLDTLGRIGREF
jgi:OB-fold nucleic acid binding domain.